MLIYFLCCICVRIAGLSSSVIPSNLIHLPTPGQVVVTSRLISFILYVYRLIKRCYVTIRITCRYYTACRRRALICLLIMPSPGRAVVILFLLFKFTSLILYVAINVAVARCLTLLLFTCYFILNDICHVRCRVSLQCNTAFR